MKSDGEKTVTVMEKKTTATNLQAGWCYCLSKKEMIRLSDCILIDGCWHEKACTTRSAKDYQESLKKVEKNDNS